MHEKEAKTILSTQNGMNLYCGCSYGCVLCDVRATGGRMKHPADDIEIRVNAPELLEVALRRKRSKCMIMTGSMGDPYQPVEEERGLMRRCLEVKSDTVTLKSELEFTTSYLELQAARFGDRIAYSIESDVDDDYLILPLIIQPLVENAFVHGIESSKSNGKIDIRIYYCGECVYLDVSDNGKGITPERLREINDKLAENDTSSGKSIGLTNVNKRVKMYFGDEYGLSVRSTPGQGTEMRVILPRNPETKSH